MTINGFSSGLADEMESYLAYKVSSGFKRTSFIKPLQKFDRFCIERSITTIRFTKNDAEAWMVKRPDEATTTHYSRVNFVKNFLVYLGRKGLDVYIPQDIRFIPTDFQPHIYTDNERDQYFRAVDTYNPDKGNN